MNTFEKQIPTCAWEQRTHKSVKSLGKTMASYHAMLDSTEIGQIIQQAADATILHMEQRPPLPVMYTVSDDLLPAALRKRDRV